MRYENRDTFDDVVFYTSTANRIGFYEFDVVGVELQTYA